MIFLTDDIALWEFRLLLDESRLGKRRGVYRGKQSKPTKVKSKSVLDLLPEIKESYIDSIADVSEKETASLDIKKVQKI